MVSGSELQGRTLKGVPSFPAEQGLAPAGRGKVSPHTSLNVFLMVEGPAGAEDRSSSYLPEPSFRPLREQRGFGVL